MARHKWTETKEVPENMKSTFGRLTVCGNCGCERYTSKLYSSLSVYVRNGQHYTNVPQCFTQAELDKTID